MVPSNECCYSYIPEDIVVNILAKLPLNSLLRFRFVSKQWYMLISQRFTRVQKIAVFSSKIDGYGRDYNLLRSIDQAKQVVETDIMVPGAGSRSFNGPCGSCKGLFLLQFHNKFFLWNPATRRSQQLPYRKLPYIKPDSRRVMPATVVSGLCFDSCSCDYKAVWGFIRYGTSRLSQSYTRVLVANTKTRHWKCVASLTGVEFVSDGVVLHNNLHWLTKNRKEAVQKIVYFDAKVDKFVYLPVPKPQKIIGLGALDECLCMCRREKPNDETYTIMVMKEYGVKESWTVLFKFINSSYRIERLVPLLYTQETKRRILMHVREFGRSAIVVYDIDTASYEDIYFTKPNERIENAVVYEDILLLPLI